MESHEVKRGRPCEVCKSLKRKDLEEALYSHVPISQISQRYAISCDSIYRHIRNHAAPALKKSFKATESMNAASIAQRMLEIANAARDVRENAVSDSVALRAGAAELQTLQVMANRLGIAHESMMETVEGSLTLGRTIGELSKKHPGFGELMVQELSDRGAENMAAALSSILLPPDED